MATGDIASTIKLGRPGKELELTANNTAYVSPDFSVEVARYEVANMNMEGETFTRVFRRHQPSYTVHVNHCSTQMRDALMSLYTIPDEHLSFVFADDWRIYSERYVLETTSAFYLRSSSYLLHDQAYNAISGAAQFSILAVWNTYSAMGTQATSGTVLNYYDTGTAMSRTDWKVPITPALTTGTALYVNYTYKGALVKMSRAPSVKRGKSFPNNVPSWDVGLILKGV